MFPRGRFDSAVRLLFGTILLRVVKPQRRSDVNGAVSVFGCFKHCMEVIPSQQTSSTCQIRHERKLVRVLV